MKIFAILCFLLVGCSRLSKNQIKQDDVLLIGGRYEGKIWETPLPLKRTSWFQELTLMFDLYWGKLDSKSPFYSWFSELEKDNIKDCREFYVGFSYENDTRTLDKKSFFKKLEKIGIERTPIPNFEDHLKVHPDFGPLSLRLYEVNGFCLSKNKSLPAKWTFIFNGYDPISLN